MYSTIDLTGIYKTPITLYLDIAATVHNIMYNSYWLVISGPEKILNSPDEDSAS